jgi:hypothetical protein
VQTYRDADGRELEVSFSLDSEQYTDAELKTYADAVADCKVESDGTTLTFMTQVDDEHGDQGLQIIQNTSASVAGQADPVVFFRYSQVFRYGSIGVEINGTDGVDEKTYAVSDFDTDLIDSLTTTIDGALSEIAKGN